MAQVGQSIIYDLRSQLFTHLQDLSLSFYSHYSVGRVITRVINDVGVLREFITWALLAVARDLFALVGIAGMAVKIGVMLKGAGALVDAGVDVKLDIVGFGVQEQLRIRGVDLKGFFQPQKGEPKPPPPPYWRWDTSFPLERMQAPSELISGQFKRSADDLPIQPNPAPRCHRNRADHPLSKHQPLRPTLPVSLAPFLKTNCLTMSTNVCQKGR